MDLRRTIYAILGLICLCIGFSHIIHSVIGINSFVIFQDAGQKTTSVVGIVFTMAGFFFLSKTRKEKGQAAIEFLMTYGWAIVAAVIVIGAFSYYGVSSGRLQPETAVLSPPLYAQGIEMYSGDVNAQIPGIQSAARIEIKNNLGQNLQISNAVLIADNGITCAYQYDQATPIAASTSKIIILECNNELIADQRVKGNLYITYEKQGSGLELISSGEASAKVRGGTYTLETCANTIDDDLDNFADCDDTDCFSSPSCSEEGAVEDCTNGLDDDEDGFTDCADDECTGEPVCIPEDKCNDGEDNEEDGATDCEDPDCDGQVCASEGSECSSFACAETDCEDGSDNDDDGLKDCNDTDCFSQPGCTGAVEICNDGNDNDGDGKIDCDDTDDCASDPNCK